jgi:hypothetical protein
MDFNALAAKMKTIPTPRQDRDFLGEGKHVVRIAGVETITSQKNGHEIVILEFDVISSTTQAEGALLKQMFDLNAAPWRVTQSLGYIEALIEAAAPGVDLDGDYLQACMTGGKRSAVAGRVVLVTATPKVSENGIRYLRFSYSSATEDTKVAAPAPQTAVVPQVEAPQVANVQVTAEEDDEPAFDI